MYYGRLCHLHNPCPLRNKDGSNVAQHHGDQVARNSRYTAHAVTTPAANSNRTLSSIVISAPKGI